MHAAKLMSIDLSYKHFCDVTIFLQILVTKLGSPKGGVLGSLSKSKAACHRVQRSKYGSRSAVAKP